MLTNHNDKIFPGISIFHPQKKLRRKKLNKGPKRFFKNKKARFKKCTDFGKKEFALAKAKAREIIKDFEEEGPSRFILVNLHFLSKALKRNLKIVSAEDNLELLIGQNRSKNPPIYLEYHKSGHWTSKGDFPRQNKCLFKAIASQISRKPAEIRYLTIKEMKINENHIAKKIADVEKLESRNPFELTTYEVQYNGTSAKDAKKILDNSQKNTCHPQNVYGHPRGHASHPSAEGPTESVENYSKNCCKTGFLSRSDQDFVADLTLDSDIAQEAIEKLNKGSINEVVDIRARELDHDDLPLANVYKNGLPVGDPKPFRRVKAILRRPSKKRKGFFLHVQSIYPIIDK